MCTAIAYSTKDHYFGRTLDMEISYNERVLITPRRYDFVFRYVKPLYEHYAIIGMGITMKGYPLYYDATNEKGLSMAGLRFPEFVDYKPVQRGKDNVATFELIPWILGQCQTVEEAIELLENVNVTGEDFSEEFPAAPLHWMISDREKSITLECLKEGIQIYDNPVGVLTNSPSFEMQMFNLNNYIRLSPEKPTNCFSDKIQLNTYSYGMGALGMPGDLSSMSRFVRASFTKLNSVCGETESESISQFFHILGSVYQQNGCVRLNEDEYEKTVYTSCCNVDKGIYYYKSYDNSQICAVKLFNENLSGQRVECYKLVHGEQIYCQN
ncbi:MAG: choloylglycine hydrolase [Lachnospiraceae bacterium]|nr:choloylglycine hydrolase [Lachnospiraceae bacterium]